jgi:hypothetical protein
MREIELSNGMVTKVDDEDFIYLSQFNFHFKKQTDPRYKYGYAYRVIWNKETKTKKALDIHREIMNAKKGECVDHINHDTLDNRKENLRICTHQQNMCNKAKLSNTSNLYKGVSIMSRNKLRPYVAMCGGDFVGCFKTELEAAMAYNGRAKELYGEFAVVNDCGFIFNYVPDKIKNKTSKYIGVRRFRNKDKKEMGWTAYYNSKYIGYFKTEDDAKQARDKYVENYNKPSPEYYIGNGV